MLYDASPASAGDASYHGSHAGEGVPFVVMVETPPVRRLDAQPAKAYRWT